MCIRFLSIMLLGIVTIYTLNNESGVEDGLVLRHRTGRMKSWPR